MPRPARRILVACLLALYGPVSMCGMGIHQLACSISAHHDHAGELCGEGEIPSISAAVDHCPLCEFQAQGQLTAEPPRLASRPFDQPHIAIILATIATRRRHLSCSPRAPPSPSASLA